MTIQQSPKNENPSTERDRLFAAIGRIVVNFQQIELCVSEALAQALGLPSLENRYIVQASMSFRQKVDLLMELLNRTTDHDFTCSTPLARRALGAAEEFRNGVVHAFWGIDGMGKWIRTKSTLKGKHGFALKTTEADINFLEEASDALVTVRHWEFKNDDSLQIAIDVFSKYHGQA